MFKAMAAASRVLLFYQAGQTSWNPDEIPPGIFVMVPPISGRIFVRLQVGLFILLICYQRRLQLPPSLSLSLAPSPLLSRVSSLQSFRTEESTLVLSSSVVFS